MWWSNGRTNVCKTLGEGSILSYILFITITRGFKPLFFIFKKNKTLYFSKQTNREISMLSKEEKLWNLNIMF